MTSLGRSKNYYRIIILLFLIAASVMLTLASSLCLLSFLFIKTTLDKAACEKVIAS